MTTYKFTYFPVRARGELSRLIFAAAEQKYEEVVLPPAKWPALKPSTPYLQIPILEFGGKVLAQSQTIERYLARKFDLFGSTAEESAIVDEVQESLGDILDGFLPVFSDSAKAEAFAKGRASELLAGVEKRVQGPFVLGKKLSLADVAVFRILDEKFLAPVAAKFPKLQAIVAAVAKLPGVAAYLKTRPAGDH